MLLKLGDTNSLHASNKDIIVQLSQYMYQKRCLVVVDNWWTELWDLVNAVFPDGNNGSRVLMISTKDERKNDYKYRLPYIGWEQQLYLTKLVRKNFLDSSTKPEIPDEQFESLFLDDRFETHWTYGDETWYGLLPSVLKTCIVYMAGVFPCGSIVPVDSLIRLRIVEGIIPHEEGRTMEDIAESYLDQLVTRGLLRIIRSYYHNQANYTIRSIILQTMVHYLINLEAHQDEPCNKEGFSLVTQIICPRDLNEHREPSSTNMYNPNLHRLALYWRYQFNRISSFEKGTELQFLNYPNLHSLFFFGYVAPVASSPFNFLRVLVVFSSHIKFPEEYTPCWLDGLISLRYLGFIVCLVEGGSLGRTLHRLGKLEILDLSASIVSGLSEFIKNNKKVNIVGPVKEELPENWSPVPDMSQ